MMFRKKSRSSLETKLAAVEAAIAAHPLSSGPVAEAHAVIRAEGTHDREKVERELAARGLPGLAELGRMTVTQTTSWWKLHRNRRRIVLKLNRSLS